MCKKKKSSVWIFVVIFTGVFGWMLITNMAGKAYVPLSVKDNAGTAVLETVGNSLVGVFQDGKVVVWDWADTPVRRGSFSVGTDRVCVLNSERLLAVSKTGPKTVSVVDLADGAKMKEFSVGKVGQEVWPRISWDKKIIALMRQNMPDSSKMVRYEFMTVDLDNEMPGVPSILTLQQKTQAVVDFAVYSDRMLYAVGSEDNIGRIVAMDLDRGRIRWNKTYEGTKEFCSVMLAPDGLVILAGNRNGVLYHLDAKTGEITKTIQLLVKGETRPITNDYSVLNAAFSPDGKYYVVTINPKAYLLDAVTHKIIHVFLPANKLVSRITFSPDNQFIASSDIRAGWPVKIWPFPEVNKQ